MSNRTELLEKAIIELIIQNAELKSDLIGTKDSKDFWYSQTQKLEEQLEDLKTGRKE